MGTSDMTVLTIAQHHQKINQTTGRKARRVAHKAKGTSWTVTQEQRIQMQTLRRQNMSIKKIADIVDVSYSCVYYYVGHIKNKTRKVIFHKRDEILELRKQGKTMRFIADLFGVCDATIYNVIQNKYRT